MEDNYLESIKAQFEYYKMLGEKSFRQLTENDLFWSYNDQSNSIAIIVKHLAGNMKSRWTDFLHSDGEKEWRKRDEEFIGDFKSEAELISAWEEGWDCLFTAIDSINRSNFNTIVYIRNMGHTIPEAINRQLGHYAYHIGQIVFIAKMLKDDKWTSLSIPKGASKEYNNKKFSEKKRKEHFTKEFLEKNDDNETL